MSYDLTGATLSGYMLKVVRDIASRSPRFRSSLGDVAPVSSNMISWGDVQVIIKDVSADGVRLSPNYFVSTMLGRAILAKVGDKEGSFVEWVTEVDKAGNLLDPGVYYLNVDEVDESNKNVSLTMQKFKWRQGFISNAGGTKIAFLPGIDATTVVPSDPDNSSPILYQSGGSYLFLLTPVSSLVIKDSQGNVLTPNTDYWVERNTETVILQSTQFGYQSATIPSTYFTKTLVNSEGYVFREGLDFIFTSPTTVQFSAWTAAGQTISVTGTEHLDPTIPANIMNPENTLNFSLEPGESLVPDQIFISTQDAEQVQITPNDDGSVSLPLWLPPGGYCKYEVRISTPCVSLKAKKNSVNPSLIPGLWITIGDRTVVDDQVCIIISPCQTQTYEVYGSKDNVRFTLDVRANDPATASELVELIKDNILIFRRIGMESDGLAIFEAARSSQSGQRDNSGLYPTFTYSLNVTGAADWRVFIPLITRITAFDITPQPYTSQFGYLPSGAPRFLSLGYGGFIPEYR